MARFDSGIYADGSKYGAAAVTETGVIAWTLAVDWDDSGTFDGSSEAGRMIKIRIKDGREHYLASGGGGFDHMRPATVNLTMDNYDRRYDPRNASSPLYPNVRRGHKVQIRVRDNVNDVFYTLFTGLLDDIRPAYTPWGGECTFECVGYLQQLNDTELSASVAQIGTTITGALQALLADVQYPGGILLDTDAQPVVSFGPIDMRAGQVAHDLADAALGTFFVDRLGRARFYGRAHTGWTTHTVDQAQLGIEIETTQTWDSQFNQILVTSQNQIYKQASVIFYLSTPVYVEVGTPVTIYPKYSPARDVQFSTIEGNTTISGDGTDISADLTVTPTLGMGGGTVVVSTTTTGYITKLEIRGREFGASPEEFSETDTTQPASVFGLKRFNLDSPYLQDRNFASAFVGILGSDNDFLYAARDAFVVTIDSRPDLQFKIELLDKVALTSAYLNVDDTFYVLGIQHESGSTMQDITTTLWLDKILSDDTAITAAGISEEQQQAPTGYDNPAGDPGTTGIDIDPGNPYVLPRTVTAYGSAALTSAETASGTMTFTTEFSDPDGMIAVPSTDIIIPESGYYLVSVNAEIFRSYNYTALTDTTGALALISRLNLFQNGSTVVNSRYYTTYRRFYYNTTNTWNGFGDVGFTTIAAFAASDVLTVGWYYNISSTPSNTFHSCSMTCDITVSKVKELPA